MTEIKLDAASEYKVTVGGTFYMLREPTVGEVEVFKNDETDGVEGLVKFLAGLGMPVEATKALTVSNLKKLVNGIVEGLSEKK
jgi:hypothetical protein